MSRGPCSGTAKGVGLRVGLDVWEGVKVGPGAPEDWKATWDLECRGQDLARGVLLPLPCVPFLYLLPAEFRVSLRSVCIPIQNLTSF